MEFYFDITTTKVYRALKISSMPLFAYSKLCVQITFYAFMISLVAFLFHVIGMSLPLFVLILFIVSLEFYSFLELKIKKIVLPVLLSDALASAEQHNIAEFLTIESADIIDYAINFAHQKGSFEISSEFLLYAGLVKSNDIKTLVFRLGIDVVKLQNDVKNSLEKIQTQAIDKKSLQYQQLSFLESFKKVIQEAAQATNKRNPHTIGGKEIFIALATPDVFFKKVLVGQDLKVADVENLNTWLGAIEEKIDEKKKIWKKENLFAMGSLGRDFAAGFTLTLDRFSIDISKKARRDMFQETLSHQKEINEIETILSKSEQSNVLLVGDEGVGKKSIIGEIARRCNGGLSLPELYGKRVVELDAISLVSQIQDREQLEATLDNIFKECLLAGNIILVIDELDNFVGQTSEKLGTVDFSGILAKYLAIGDFHFIGITTPEGLHSKLEQYSLYMKYLRKIKISEMSESETIRILQNLIIGIEQRSKMVVLYPSIREIVHLTGRYFPGVPFPKKAIDVLDEAVAYVRSLKDLPAGRHGRIILPHHIAQIISDKSQIPVGKMDFKEKSVLLNLENLIHQRIVNQSEAVTEISTAMRRARSGLGSTKRPMGTFLFLGPTGVGKTETAKALAEIYFGRVAKDFSLSEPAGQGEEKMIRLDMSEFQSISDISRLIGSMHPVQEQGILTTLVREKPFSLILIDEIEKAHHDILNLFLQIFDEGHITDGQGRKVIFSNTIIICTSNAGASEILSSIESGNIISKEALLNNIFKQGIFKPEFINRFDATVVFHPLTKENLMDIAQINLSSLAAKLKEQEINFTITESLKEKIVQLSYKPEFGAREMRRIMQDNVENEIAKALLSDTIKKGDTIEMNPENFSIVRLHGELNE